MWFKASGNSLIICPFQIALEIKKFILQEIYCSEREPWTFCGRSLQQIHKQTYLISNPDGDPWSDSYLPVVSDNSAWKLVSVLDMLSSFSSMTKSHSNCINGLSPHLLNNINEYILYLITISFNWPKVSRVISFFKGCRGTGPTFFQSYKWYIPVITFSHVPAMHITPKTEQIKITHT